MESNCAVRRVFRSAYDPQMRVAIDASAGGRTQQNFKDECDVNVIMARYLATGVVPGQFGQQEQRFLEASTYDFQDAMFLVAGAASAFEQLPAKLRDRFQNEPSRLLEFLNDDRNRAEAVELGLVVVPPPPAPLADKTADHQPKAEAAPADPAQGRAAK